MATTSLVLGLISLVGGLMLTLPLVLGIPAVITGLVAVRRIYRSQGRQTGKGLAIAGMVTGALSSLCMFTVVPVLGYVVWRAVWERAAWAESQNNLRQLSLAMMYYHDTNNCFPPQATAVMFKPGDPIVPGNPNGPPKVQPAVSWRVLLLPFLEESPLFEQFNTFEPWDSPQNQGLSTRTVKVYQMPRDTSVPANHTFYQVFYGDEMKSPHALFDAPSWRQPGFVQRGPRIDQIMDGSSNTLMVVEAATAVPWAKPADIFFDPDQPPPALGNHFARGTQAVTADGTVHNLPRTLSPMQLHALITRDGVEINDIPDW
jgi:hypothetical protein